MTEIKVEDWVVFVRRYGCNDLVEVIGFEEYPAQTWVQFKFFNGDIDRKPIEDVRLPRKEEIAAGHRIDTPPNAPTAPYSHDLPKDGAMVQDVNKEAVASSRSEFERAFQNSLTYQHLEQANYFQKAIFAFNDATGKYIHYVVQAAYEMWQHQQAVVTTLTEALDIKEQLNQKLREREEELQKRVGACQAMLSENRIQFIKGGKKALALVDEITKALGADHEAP